MSDMEEILTELQRMIEINPEAYQKIMESMSKSLYSTGTNTDDNLPHVTTGGISGNDGGANSNMSINQMAEAIMRMRNASVEGKESDLIMSKDKPKQVLDIVPMILMMMMMMMMMMMIAFTVITFYNIDIAKRNPYYSNSRLHF